MDFCEKYKHLDYDEAFYFYAVFDEKYFKASLNDIYYYIEELVKNYNPDEFELTHNECKAMCHYARKSRLEFSINKTQSRFKARKSFHSLIEKSLIKLELGDFKSSANAQNKIIFNSNYVRFYFYFLKAFERLILEDETTAFNLICKKFNDYLAYIYEMVAKEWCELFFDVNGFRSIWARDYECDLYYQDYDLSVLGEVKFKGRKMCLSDYSRLLNKARQIGFEPEYFVLFSKSGFSKKLLSLNDKRLILANHKDFRRFKRD